MLFSRVKSCIVRLTLIANHDRYDIIQQLFIKLLVTLITMNKLQAEDYSMENNGI